MMRVKVRHSPGGQKTAAWFARVQRRRWGGLFWTTAVNANGYIGHGWHYTDPAAAARNAVASYENRPTFDHGSRTYHVPPTWDTYYFYDLG